jgi:hypothetical protein
MRLGLGLGLGQFFDLWGTYLMTAQQASWTTPAWFIDPVSGSDSNSGKTSGSAFKTFRQLLNTWGTNAPVLAQATTITFLSSQPDNTDPVVLRPTLVDPGALFLNGTLLPVSWGSSTLGAVTAASNTAPLGVNLNQAASAAVGYLLDNTTHPSRCWVDSAAVNVATITNPMLKAVIPTAATLLPTSGQGVAGTAMTDSFTIKKPVQVYVVDFSPTVAAGPASFNGPQATMSQIWVPDTGGAGASQCTLNDNVWLQECRIDSFVRYQAIALNNGNPYGMYNCWCSGGGLFIGSQHTAGAIGTLANFNQWFDSCFLDGGILTSGQNNFQSTGGQKGSNILGLVYLLGGVTHQVNSGLVIVKSSGYGFGLKGSFGFNVNPGATLGYKTSAATTFLGTTTLKINGDTTAWSVTTAQPSVWNGGITINVANLDAAVGAAGFGGFAVDFYGGGSIIKTP